MHSYYRRACLYSGIFLFLLSLFIFIFTLHTGIFSIGSGLKFGLVTLVLSLAVPFLMVRFRWMWIVWVLALFFLGIFLGRIFMINESLKSLQPPYDQNMQFLSLYAQKINEPGEKIGYVSSLNPYGLDLYQQAQSSKLEYMAFSSQSDLRMALAKKEVQAILLPSNHEIQGLVRIDLFGYTIMQYQEPSDLSDLKAQAFVILVVSSDQGKIVKIDPALKQVVVQDLDWQESIETYCEVEMDCLATKAKIGRLSQENMGTLEVSLERKYGIQIDYVLDFKRSIDFRSWVSTPIYWNMDLNEQSLSTNMDPSVLKQLFLLQLGQYTWLTQ